MYNCGWKLVNPESFILGQTADRCNLRAAVKMKRPTRKTDLFLCELHLNEFIRVWGLNNELAILRNNDEWNRANGLDWEDF